MANESPVTLKEPALPSYASRLIENAVGPAFPEHYKDVLNAAWDSAYRARGCAHVLHQFMEQMNAGSPSFEEWHVDYLVGMVAALKREISDTLTLISDADRPRGEETP